MGSPKQLADWHGEPLVRTTAQVLIDSSCAAVFVIVGAGGEAVRGALRGLPIEVVEASGWRRGVGASIACAMREIAAVEPPFEAVVLLHADQPLVTSTGIDSLVAASIAGGCSRAASRYADTLGVPALFDRSHFAALAALDGDQGAKHLLQAPEDVAAIDLPEAAADMDRPEDLEKWRDRGP
jgi:molybdenum cofactor cytidylyltransferase